MLKGKLLKGQATGAPLFLAWMLGLLLLVSVMHGLVLTGAFSSDAFSAWIAYVCCITPVFAWYGVLLVNTVVRRAAWALTFILAAPPDLSVPHWYDPIMGAAVLQAMLLIGLRKRIWAWLAGILVNSTISLALETAYSLYEKFTNLLLQASIPGHLILEFYLVRFLAGMSLLGAIVAFLMPPVRPDTKEN